MKAWPGALLLCKVKDSACYCVLPTSVSLWISAKVFSLFRLSFCDLKMSSSWAHSWQAMISFVS